MCIVLLNFCPACALLCEAQQPFVGGQRSQERGLDPTAISGFCFWLSTQVNCLCTPVAYTSCATAGNRYTFSHRWDGLLHSKPDAVSHAKHNGLSDSDGDVDPRCVTWGGGEGNSKTSYMLLSQALFHVLFPGPQPRTVLCFFFFLTWKTSPWSCGVAHHARFAEPKIWERWEVGVLMSIY